MSYWSNRQKQLNSQMEKDESRLKKRLSTFYSKEFARLDKEIAAYYQKYGADNVIQYRNLMKALSDDDRKLLMERMNDFAIRYPQYAYLIPVRESIYKLNRLEGLQYSVKMQQLEIGAVNNEEIKAHLDKQAERGVTAAAETLGFGKNFYANNPDITKLFVDVPWSNGENFSSRIWKDTGKLAAYLNQDIAQGIARGDSYDRLVRNLRTRFDKVSRSDAYRLIYTEGTYVMAEATMHPFTDDFKQYKVSTARDGKVCSICSSMAQEVFEIEDRTAGTSFPPFHPWCRCTFELVVDDWDAWMEEYERKHGNGQAGKIKDRVYIDGSRKVAPGEKTYISGNRKYRMSFKNTDVSDKIKSRDEKGIIAMEYQSLGTIGAKKSIEEEFGELFTSEIIVMDERAEHIKNHHPNDYDLFQEYGKNAVNDPDCVIKDGKNENTVFMVRHLENSNLNVVVKVSVDMKHPEYKNSVITFYRIRDKNLKKLENKENNKILYKKE